MLPFSSDYTNRVLLLDTMDTDNVFHGERYSLVDSGHLNGVCSDLVLVLCAAVIEIIVPLWHYERLVLRGAGAPAAFSSCFQPSQHTAAILDADYGAVSIASIPMHTIPFIAYFSSTFMNSQGHILPE